MSTPIQLAAAIKQFIDGVLQDNASLQPRVYEGYLPQKLASNTESDFPYVIVRLHKGEDGESGHPIIVNLIFGSESQDNDGYRDILNIMERVRLAFMKNRTLHGQFRLELPYKWELFEDQPYPEWIGKAVTTWTIPSLTEEVEGI